MSEKKALEEIDKALESERREQKVRITTFIDGDILDELKAQASKEGLGYQTLLNQYLRSSVLKEVPSSLINRLLSSAKEAG
jgi:predicted DNA binding CopG/RHH family protein